MNISLSPEAVESLRSDAGSRVLRIAFTTGCGGSGYRLSWENEPLEGDTVEEIDGVRIALDGMAHTRLDGAVIRYDADEDGYVVDHPDAAVAVWCG
jgi:Fe-S cluster assembly iron-binding protein IscA